MTRVGWIAAGVESRLSVAGHAKRPRQQKNRAMRYAYCTRGLVWFEIFSCADQSTRSVSLARIMHQPFTHIIIRPQVKSCST